MKSEQSQKETDEQQLRQKALEMALCSCGYADHETVLKAARAYEAYLREK